MITNIQALRAIAALAVVVYHTDFRFFHASHDKFQGVAIFFVISGLIMTHIVLKDDRETKVISFMTHRLIRIVPLYWFSLAAFIALSNLGLLNPMPFGN